MQSGDIGSYQGLNPNVAGLGEQHRTEAQGQSLDLSSPFADMGKGLGKMRSLGDLEQQIRQINPGKPGGNGRSKSREARRLVELIQRTQDQSIFAIAGFDAHGGVANMAKASFTPVRK